MSKAELAWRILLLAIVGGAFCWSQYAHEVLGNRNLTSSIKVAEFFACRAPLALIAFGWGIGRVAACAFPSLGWWLEALVFMAACLGHVFWPLDASRHE